MNVFGDNVQITGQLFIHVQSDLFISKSSIPVESYQQILKKIGKEENRTRILYIIEARYTRTYILRWKDL